MLADLQEANLSGADLRRADLSGASFLKADLRHAKLANALLKPVELRGSHGEVKGRAIRTSLRGALTDDIDMTHVDLTDAQVDEAAPGTGDA